MPISVRSLITDKSNDSSDVIITAISTKKKTVVYYQNYQYILNIYYWDIERDRQSLMIILLPQFTCGDEEEILISQFEWVSLFLGKENINNSRTLKVGMCFITWIIVCTVPSYSSGEATA